jgi:hypothetical protein
MDAPNPARQMAPIRKARCCGNLGKAEFSIPNHFDRPSQSRMNDITIRAHADGSGEGARKMKRTAVGHFRKRRDVEGFVTVKLRMSDAINGKEGRRAGKVVRSWRALRSLLCRWGDIHGKKAQRK